MRYYKREYFKLEWSRHDDLVALLNDLKLVCTHVSYFRAGIGIVYVSTRSSMSTGMTVAEVCIYRHKKGIKLLKELTSKPSPRFIGEWETIKAA